MIMKMVGDCNTWFEIYFKDIGGGFYLGKDEEIVIAPSLIGVLFFRQLTRTCCR